MIALSRLKIRATFFNVAQAFPLPMKNPKLAPPKAATSTQAVSIKTAALMLECSEKSIRRLIKRGLLKPCRALRVIRIPLTQIEQLLQSEC